MQITGYDNFTFSTLTMAGEMPVDQGVGWSINQVIVPRGSSFPALGTSQPSPYSLDVEFVYTGTRTDYWQIFAELTGKLNPLDQSARRKLYATRPDGTLVWRYAKINMPAWWTDEDVNSVTVRFISSDPRWHAVAETVVDALGSSAGGSVVLGANTPAIAIPNGGQAVVYPEILVADGTSVGFTGQWPYRRRQTVTNNLARTVSNTAVMLELGDTAALVTAGKALASGNDLRVIAPNGEELARDLVAWNTLGSKVWIRIASIAPGETQYYDILYGNATAGSPPVLSYPDKPAFLTDWVWMNGNAGGDATKLFVDVNTVPAVGTFAGDVSGLERDNKYKDGALFFLTGANAGSGRKISTTVYTSGTLKTRLTFTSAFTNAIATTDDWVLLSSRNGVWMYDTDSTINRGTDKARGRWYSSSGESPPGTISYEVPGAWKPYLYKDGRDKKGQPRYTRVQPTAGGDDDTYTILNAQRSWENGGLVEEEGVADGVSISLPFEITDYQWDGFLINATGMAKGFIGGRPNGGNDWSTLDSLDTVGLSTAWSTASLSFPSGIAVTQLYHGLIPYEGDEITQDWHKDGGSSTAVGTTSTIVDSTKSWRVDQWVGAKLTFTAGRRSGTVRTVTANTATTLTFTAAFGTNTKVDQQYELLMPKVRSRLVDGKRCTVTFDMAGLSIPSLGAEAIVLDVNTRMWIGGGSDPDTVIAGQKRVAVNLGVGDDNWLTLDNGDESILVDSARRTIDVRDSTGATVLYRLADPRVRFRYTDELGIEMQSCDGLPLPIGANLLSNPGAESGVSEWDAAISGTISASGPTQDATVYALQGGGSKSFKLTIASSTGPAYIQSVAFDRIAVLPGELVTVAGFVRTTNASIVPLLGIVFFDALGAVISTDLQTVSAIGTGVWQAEGHAAIAPSGLGVVAYAPVVRANIASGSPTGSIYFDDMNAGSPVLFVDSDEQAHPGLTITFTEAYLL